MPPLIRSLVDEITAAYGVIDFVFFCFTHFLFENVTSMAGVPKPWNCFVYPAFLAGFGSLLDLLPAERARALNYVLYKKVYRITGCLWISLKVRAFLNKQAAPAPARNRDSDPEPPPDPEPDVPDPTEVIRDALYEYLGTLDFAQRPGTKDRIMNSLDNVWGAISDIKSNTTTRMTKFRAFHTATQLARVELRALVEADVEPFVPFNIRWWMGRDPLGVDVRYPVLPADTNMRALVQSCKGRNVHHLLGPIAEWDTSLVLHMTAAFEGYVGDALDLSRWSTVSVLSMVAMFKNARATVHGLSGWDVHNVVRMDSMFESSEVVGSAKEGVLIYLGMWDVKSVESVKRMMYDSMAMVFPPVFNDDVNRFSMYSPFEPTYGRDDAGDVLPAAPTPAPVPAPAPAPTLARILNATGMLSDPGAAGSAAGVSGQTRSSGSQFREQASATLSARSPGAAPVPRSAPSRRSASPGARTAAC